MSNPTIDTWIRRHSFLTAAGNGLLMGGFALLALQIIEGATTVKFFMVLPAGIAVIGFLIPILVLKSAPLGTDAVPGESRQVGLSSMMKSSLIWLAICFIAILIFLIWPNATAK